MKSIKVEVRKYKYLPNMFSCINIASLLVIYRLICAWNLNKFMERFVSFTIMSRKHFFITVTVISISSEHFIIKSSNLTTSTEDICRVHPGCWLLKWESIHRVCSGSDEVKLKFPAHRKKLQVIFKRMR